jgi:hypothetical protein
MAFQVRIASSQDYIKTDESFHICFVFFHSKTLLNSKKTFWYAQLCANDLHLCHVKLYTGVFLFQLVDDVLDFVASENEMGKPTSADLKLGLATAPVLFACEKVQIDPCPFVLQLQ